MKAMLLLAMTVIAAAPAFAGDPQETTLDPVRASHEKPISGFRAMQLVALETNLSAPQVRTVLRTESQHARYQFRAQRNWANQAEESLGTARFAALINGQPIELYSPAVLQAVRGMNGVAATEATSGIRIAANP